jgi:hypothetical protein
MSEADKNQVARELEQGTVEAESRYHHYTGNDIPWYVRAMWLGFWILAVAYTIQWLFPALQVELFQKP